MSFRESKKSSRKRSAAIRGSQESRGHGFLIWKEITLANLSNVSEMAKETETVASPQDNVKPLNYREQFEVRICRRRLGLR